MAQTPERGNGGKRDGEATSAVPSSEGGSRAAGSAGQFPSGGLIAPLDEAMPARIGRYVIQRRLGEGGMGVVYLASRDEPGFAQVVALKVVKRGMDTDDILRRFSQERQLLSGLAHPNIARLLDGGTTEDGRPYFVMEYVEGQALDVYCDRNRLTVDSRLKLFKKICAAVHHAHMNLIVHRDLKPGNILVTKDGEPKLLDFGIAKVLNPGMMPSAGVTGPEIRLMTPEYASPEQVRGDPLTTSSDVYALGVLLYELLTGRRPYRFRTRLHQEIARVICESDPERPSTVVTRVETSAGASGELTTLTPDEVARSREDRPVSLRRKLEGDLDDIVLMAMEKSAQKRYGSAEALAADIDRHLGGLPVAACRHSGAIYVAGKYVRRHKVGVACAGAIAAAVVGGGAVATWQWSRAESALRQSRERYALVTRLASLFMRESAGAGAFPTLEERSKMSSEAVSALEAMGEGRPDESLRSAIGAGYHRLAELSAGLRGQSEGDVPRARALAEKALAIRRGLSEVFPENETYRAQLAMTWRLTGDLRSKSGDTPGASEAYGRSLELFDGLSEGARRERSNDAQRSSVVTSLAMMKERMGLSAEALALHRRAVESRESAYRADPTRQTRRELAAALATLCGAMQGSGDRAGALAAIERATAIRRELARDFPGDPTVRRDVAASLLRSAELALSGEGGEAASLALKHADEARGVLAALAEVDPGDVRVRMDLLLAGELRAKALQQGERTDEALRVCDEVLAGGVELIGRAPSESRPAKSAAAAQVLAGNILAGTGRHREAGARLRDGASRWRAIAAKDPENTWVSRRALDAFVACADNAEALAAEAATGERGRHLDEARGWAVEARDMLGAIMARGTPGAEDEEEKKRLEARIDRLRRDGASR